MNVLWQRRLVDRNASLGVNERRWMLLCRVIHLLGAQLLWAMSLVSGALLDYAWVISGQENLWCLLQRCYWSLQVRGSFWLQGLQAPKPSTDISPYQVQKNLPSTGRILRGMWCRSDHQGVVRVWQRSTQAGSPWVGGLLPVVDSVAKVGFSPKIVQGLRLALDVLDTRPTGVCHCWRIGVGTLVPGRCLGLGNSSCWEMKGYLMKARPCVWLDPKGGIIARVVCPGLYVFCKLVVDRY